MELNKKYQASSKSVKTATLPFRLRVKKGIPKKRKQAVGSVMNALSHPFRIMCATLLHGTHFHAMIQPAPVIPPCQLID
jgi:hypothetical protein